MKALGLDIGSSTIKGAVLNLDQGAIGASVSVPFPAPDPGLPPGWFEVSPEGIETAVRNVLQALLEQVSSPVGLYVSGQMGGVLVVDHDGRPLSNYISWRDQRSLQPLSDAGRNVLDEIRARWDDRLFSSLGNELQAGSTTALLFWLTQRQLLPSRGIPVSVGDYVVGRLCGQQPAMHVTHAIGLLDLAAVDWHRTALAQLGLDSVALPALATEIQSRGWAHIAGRRFPVCGAYGDQQCALRGAGLSRGELSLNISTGSQVSQRVDRFLPGNYQTRMYFDGDWLNTVTHLPAGRSLNALVDLLTELAGAEGVALRDPWGYLIRQAADIPHTDLEVDLAFFAGPLGYGGRISGITTENLTAGHLFHAAFRQMADNYARCAAWLDPDRSATAIVLSGGMTRSNPLLRRLIAERFPQLLRESDGEETLLGLLDLARSATAAV
uniref:Carbohydrate kinase FGGY N-terminal domain-containing protein n=1 Tax=Schlesneria paludicola TaxID=360056 RepID=A0A7C2NXX1_9PLAN